MSEEKELTNEERAKLLFERGQKGFENNNFLEALHYFKLSNKLVKTFQTDEYIKKSGYLTGRKIEGISTTKDTIDGITIKAIDDNYDLDVVAFERYEKFYQTYCDPGGPPVQPDRLRRVP